MKNDRGKEIPLGIVKYENLVKECYLISSNINTSYTDLLDISIREKDLLVNLILDKFKREKEELDKAKNKNKRKFR